MSGLLRPSRPTSAARTPAEAGYLALSVDLMPRSVTNARRSRRARRVTVLVTVAAILVSLGLGGWAALDDAEARADLDAARAEADTLRAVHAGFVELVALDDDLSRMRAIEGAAMSRDIPWSRLVESAFATLLVVAEMSGTGLEPRASVVINAVAPGDEPRAGADVLGIPGVGWLRIDVKTSTLPDVGLWAAALTELDGFADVRIAVATLEEGSDAPDFYRSTVDITVTAAAQSCRWHEETEVAQDSSLDADRGAVADVDGTEECGA